jgi:chemotaxis protein methyltransferase CheR
MNDAEGIAFLQWCLPRLGLRWRGFRRVRRIVYRRVERRLAELGLPDLAAYRAYVTAHPEESAVLDALCRIPLSRFYRDRAVFAWLADVVLPELSVTALARGRTELRCWSVGCAAGEEPYTVAIVWRLRVASRFPGLRLRVVATDVDPEMIARAEQACYPSYALRDLPADLAQRAFTPSPSGLRLAEADREGVEFLVQDVRETAPQGRFDLILCRNLVLTYFDEALQQRTLARLVNKLEPGGALVFGATESVPAALLGLVPWAAPLRIYRAAEGGSHAEDGTADRRGASGGNPGRSGGHAGRSGHSGRQPRGRRVRARQRQQSPQPA